MKSLPRYLIYLFSILSAVAACWYFLPATIRYHLTERYTFTGGPSDGEVFLSVMVPRTGPYQKIEHLKFIWKGGINTEKHTALDVLQMAGSLPASDIREAVITYDVTLWQGAARWQAPVEDLQLQPQDQIESDNSILAAQAQQLVQDSTRRDAMRLFDFTAGYLSWPQGERIGGDQSALAAYQSRIGGCGEFANLLTALCRASGIPVQSVSGLAFPAYPPLWKTSTSWGHPAGSHAWVEVNSEAGWELADPSWASNSLIKTRWFGYNDGSHLSYGEIGEHDRINDKIQTWAEERGQLIGAMSAPLKFAASASSDQITILSTVTVQKGWDGRWVNSLLIYLMGMVFIRVVEKHIRQANRT
ncbi:MAG: transglutaminase domain-containing protein [Anaerolineales bacterium]|nr:transglutaminase domain-containing protein [Anaerolineales bacterium]